jgi:perosamine synthetase
MERISEKEREYVKEALDNGFATSLNSVFNNRLEREFARRFKVPYAIGHCNGTATMHTALAALGVASGDEVIVPPLTMSSTAFAVLHNNSIPVFADVDKETFNISAECIERVITAKTRAVITVALYGLSPDYDAIMDVCRKHNLFLIEDNAECFLGEYKGRLVGEFGEFASFSFQASKHLTTGEGGMLLCRDERLADAARRFNCLGYAGVSARQGKITRQDIQDPCYARHVSLGFNYRMSELQAAVACAQLERAEELVEQRIKVALLFDEAVKTSALLRRQAEPQGYRNSYWSYSVVLNSDKPETDWYRFRELFQANGGDGYYSAWLLSYQEPVFQNDIQRRAGVWQRYGAGLCPVAEYLQKRMLQFKTNYWDLSEAEKQAEILMKTLTQY